MAWQINREVIVLLSWPPAILLQFAHPLVAAGVAEHSSFEVGPRESWCRFRRTLDAMLALTFGTSQEVEATVRCINAVHERVQGHLRDSVGIFQAGTPYSAQDPALLRWVHGTVLNSVLRVYELYVGPLTPEEKDRYCAEASAVAPLLGIPEGYLPTSVAELREYMEGMLASGEIAVGETARTLAEELLHPHWLPVIRPLLWLTQLPVA